MPADHRQQALPLDMPGLDCDRQLRAALAEAIEQSGRDRHDIAADMTRISGRRVTKTLLDAWTAPSKAKWTFPAALLPAFVAATECHDLLDVLLAPLGLKAVTEDAWNLAELGRVVAEQNRLTRTKRLLTRKLGPRA